MSSSEYSLESKEWVVVKVVNDSKTRNIKLMGLHLDEGKFHRRGDKHHEIPKYLLDNTLIEPGDSFSLYSCGRNFLFHGGTKGSFNVFEVAGDTKDFICNFFWDCPVDPKKNKAEIRAVSQALNWTVQAEGFNVDQLGALGKGRLVFADEENGSTPPDESLPGDDGGLPDGSNPPGEGDNGPPGDDGGPPDGSPLPGDNDGNKPPGEGDDGPPGDDGDPPDGSPPPGDNDGSNPPGEGDNGPPGDDNGSNPPDGNDGSTPPDDGDETNPPGSGNDNDGSVPPGGGEEGAFSRGGKEI